MFFNDNSNSNSMGNNNVQQPSQPAAPMTDTFDFDIGPSKPTPTPTQPTTAPMNNDFGGGNLFGQEQPVFQQNNSDTLLGMGAQPTPQP